MSSPLAECGVAASVSESVDLFDRLAGHQDGGMGLGQRAVLAVAGEHAEDGGVVETEARQHQVGAGQLEQLRVAEGFQQRGNFSADAKTVDGAGLVGANHLLREHQVVQICVANLSHHVIGIHCCSPVRLPVARLLYQYHLECIQFYHE